MARQLKALGSILLVVWAVGAAVASGAAAQEFKFHWEAAGAKNLELPHGKLAFEFDLGKGECEGSGEGFSEATESLEDILAPTSAECTAVGKPAKSDLQRLQIHL
ncbi:MAG TPA: hypothetical protein VHQ43_11570 [Solirubrobacterales bacterium]|jgi:hypothetical protein|nr:hypothetical protein [Solirubrobacterales bacterium]